MYIMVINITVYTHTDTHECGCILIFLLKWKQNFIIQILIIKHLKEAMNTVKQSMMFVV